MLYQRVTGDFYTINSEGKFTLPSFQNLVALFEKVRYDNSMKIRRSERRCGK